MKKILIIILLFWVSLSLFSRYGDLRDTISRITNDKHATVGVALLVDGKDTLTVTNDFRYPTQSVYKFHLALAVLDYMHKNTIPLHHKISISKQDVSHKMYSPIKDKYPEGDIEMPLADILRYTVSQSDNTGCDVLFRFIGGPKVVDNYIRSLGFTDFAISATEQEMHGPWEVQYTNWSSPYTAVGVLEAFRTKNILPDDFHNFLWNALVDTSTGQNKIRAFLPENTFIAHKTGSSFRNSDGLNAAENDIAIIRLPDGRYYCIAVFVADSMEDFDTNCRIIADISKAVYDYLINN